jgi:hypothetical protein
MTKLFSRAMLKNNYESICHTVHTGQTQSHEYLEAPQKLTNTKCSMAPITWSGKCPASFTLIVAMPLSLKRLSAASFFRACNRNSSMTSDTVSAVNVSILLYRDTNSCECTTISCS